MSDKPTVACPVCDSLHPEYVGDMGDHTLLRCTRPDCGHSYQIDLDWGEVCRQLQNDIDQLAPVLRIGQGDNRKDWP
ncbi:hypothetical protein LCGC14_1022240 [marine sediment metagenome]|uniref:Zinc finger Ogr/Delta-type domain-containing protein n=1 Tax=marine sediment metagenome TaxID=412755 RepID=A0A0F9NIQ3_9ZZZZ